MDSGNSQKTPDYFKLGVSLALALMKSASTATIRPQDWWIRCRSALERGAKAGRNYRSLINIAGKALQIEAFRETSSRLIVEIETQVLDYRAFAKELANALYIVSTAQVRNTDAKETAKGERDAAYAAFSTDDWENNLEEDCNE